jgi:hypothetical protein
MTVAASALVSAFNDKQRAYRAALIDDVFVIRPAESRAAYLDARAPGMRLRTRGLSEATRWLFAPLDSRLAPGEPHIPGGLGGKDEAGDAVQVDLNVDGRSILNVLNELVKQLPNRAWLALTTDGDTAQVGQIGFIRPNGYSLLPVSGRGRGR